MDDPKTKTFPPSGANNATNDNSKFESILNKINLILKRFDLSNLPVWVVKKLSQISIAITLIVTIIITIIGAISSSAMSKSPFSFLHIFFIQIATCIISLASLQIYSRYTSRITLCYVGFTILSSFAQAIAFVGHDNYRTYQLKNCASKGAQNCNVSDYNLPANLMITFVVFAVASTHFPITVLLTDLETIDYNQVSPEMRSIEKLNKPN